MFGRSPSTELRALCAKMNLSNATRTCKTWWAPDTAEAAQMLATILSQSFPLSDQTGWYCSCVQEAPGYIRRSKWPGRMRFPCCILWSSRQWFLWFQTQILEVCCYLPWENCSILENLFDVCCHFAWLDGSTSEQLYHLDSSNVFSWFLHLSFLRFLSFLFRSQMSLDELFDSRRKSHRESSRRNTRKGL